MFPTCCVISARDAECCFALSAGEQRILAECREDVPGAAEEINSPRFVGAMLDLFPDEPATIRRAFAPGGRHRRLAVRADGACRFLGQAGCDLPRAARPAYCRIFPFWVHRGRIRHFAMRECLAQRENRGFAALRRAFPLSDAEIFALYADIRRGWGLPAD
jgi:Fe-S-cluster containining protein